MKLLTVWRTVTCMIVVILVAPILLTLCIVMLSRGLDQNDPWGFNK
jgi:hypothetical protein